MPREKAQVAQTARPKVPMRRLGADCFVVASKRGNARGAKGAGHRHLARVNRQREEPDVQWKAAAFARWGGMASQSRRAQVALRPTDENVSLTTRRDSDRESGRRQPMVWA